MFVCGTTNVRERTPGKAIHGNARVLLTIYMARGMLLSADNMSPPGAEVPYGTLDLMVLKTLEQMGPLHGYGIARRIEQLGEQAVIVNQGTIYLCLVRLLQKRWISARWGTSENNRKAKFYAITKAGRAQLKAETENWERISGLIGRVLQHGLPADAPAKAGS